MKKVLILSFALINLHSNDIGKCNKIIKKICSCIVLVVKYPFIQFDKVMTSQVNINSEYSLEPWQLTDWSDDDSSSSSIGEAIMVVEYAGRESQKMNKKKD